MKEFEIQKKLNEFAEKGYPHQDAYELLWDILDQLSEEQLSQVNLEQREHSKSLSAIIWQKDGYDYAIIILNSEEVDDDVIIHAQFTVVSDKNYYQIEVPLINEESKRNFIHDAIQDILLLEDKVANEVSGN